MDKLINFETLHALAVDRIKELTEHGTDDDQEFYHLATWLRFTDVPEEEFMIGDDSEKLSSSERFRSLLSSLRLRMSQPNKWYSFAVFDERPRICFSAKDALEEAMLDEYIDCDERDSWESHGDLGLITFLPDAYAFTKAVEERYLRKQKQDFVYIAACHGVEYAVAQSYVWTTFSESWVTELAKEIAESAEFYARQKTARSAA